MKSFGEGVYEPGRLNTGKKNQHKIKQDRNIFIILIKMHSYLRRFQASSWSSCAMFYIFEGHDNIFIVKTCFG